MEITQINIPHIPDLQAIFADAAQIRDEKMGGILVFFKENWYWFLLGAGALMLLFFVFSPSKKEENDKPIEEPPFTPFNQPINYIQRPNGNVGQ